MGRVVYACVTKEVSEATYVRFFADGLREVEGDRIGIEFGIQLRLRKWKSSLKDCTIDMD